LLNLIEWGAPKTKKKIGSSEYYMTFSKILPSLKNRRKTIPKEEENKIKARPDHYQRYDAR